MIADTTFLIDWSEEMRSRRIGRARTFIAQRRPDVVRTTIVSLAEVAAGFASSENAWAYFSKWPIYRLHDGIAKMVADLDRERTDAGQRVGENDTWIAGFCLYYREPIISLDGRAFDRVPSLRRLAY
jgi:predicted nucleic acid-binding protein